MVDDKSIEDILPGEMIPESALKEETPELDEVEQSAQMFHILHTQFKKMAYSLANKKKRGVARVLEATMFEPLEKIELFGKDEKELFAITQQIMYHKQKIAEYAIKRHLENEEQENQKQQGELNE